MFSAISLRVTHLSIACFSIYRCASASVIPSEFISAHFARFISLISSIFSWSERVFVSIFLSRSLVALSQSTVIDMSGYNGAGGVGFDAGIITATSEYQLNVEQDGAIFYLPYAGVVKDLNEINVKVNGSTVTPERIYGDMPYYYAGLGGDKDTILEAISSVKPSVLEGTGKLYTFETSVEPLE